MRNYNTKKKFNKSEKVTLIIIAIILFVVISLLFAAFIYNDFDFLKTKNYIVSLFSPKNNNTSNNVSDDYNDGFDLIVNKDFNKTKTVGVHFVDVGQGDCAIIQFPDGKNMIIDTGKPSKSNENAIKELTNALNIQVFDYLLLTHQDSDHAGNMEFVFENYEIKYVFKPNVLSTYDKKYKGKTLSDLPVGLNTGVSDKNGGKVSSTLTYFKFLLALSNEGCEYENFNKDSDFTNSVILNGETFSYTFDFLTPTASRDSIKYKDPNDYSPICILSYGNKKVMLTGDAEKENELEYVANYGNTFDVDVLKVGHHGSLTSSQQDFLNAVKPEYAVISCNYYDTMQSYKHPRQDTINRLKPFIGYKLLRTDNNGNISLYINENGLINFSVESFTNETRKNNMIGHDNLPPKKSINCLINFKLIYDNSYKTITNVA